MRRLALVGIALGACGKKTEAPGAGSAKVAAVATIDAAAAPAAPAASKPKPAAPTPPTRAQLADYRKHLAAGRALGKDKRWGEAVGEFEAALVALPMDARALGELGFAAYQAGDYKKARKADDLAVHVAAEPKVRAASYYNLGLVADAENDAPAAVAAYRASLALRPDNAVVLKALTRLRQPGPAAAARVDQPPCPGPGTIDALCTCLIATLPTGEPPPDPDDADDKPSCDPLDAPGDPSDEARVAVAPPKGFQVLELDDRPDHERSLYLAVGAGAKARVVAWLGTAYNPGMMGIGERLSVDKLELRTIGAHQVLWIETTHEHDDSDAGIDEAESTTTHDVTVCPLAADGTPRCALTVTLDYAYERDALTDDEDPEVKANHTKGLPIHDERHLALALGADGVATVTLVKGAAPDDKRVLGPHRLW